MGEQRETNMFLFIVCMYRWNFYMNVFIILKILILSIELLYLQNYFRICNNIFENIVNINGQKVDGVQHYILYLLVEIYSTNQIQYYFLSLI